MQKANRFKTKDFVLIGIIAVIYIAVFFIIGFTTAAINPVLHAFSPAITGVIVGTVYLFLAIKIPKLGVFTICQSILILITAILGMGYLPWLIGMFIGAALGDIVAFTGKYKNKYTIAAASGFMCTGSASGGVIPILFFVDHYRHFCIDKMGMSAEQAEASIAASAGRIGVIILISTFVLGFAGVLIGSKILGKHFKNSGIR